MTYRRPRTSIYGIDLNQEGLLVGTKKVGPFEDMFDVPGGAIINGEELIDALSREVLEETGRKLVSADTNRVAVEEYVDRNAQPPIHLVGIYVHMTTEEFDIPRATDIVDVHRMDRATVEASLPRFCPMAASAIATFLSR